MSFFEAFFKALGTLIVVAGIVIVSVWFINALYCGSLAAEIGETARFISGQENETARVALVQAGETARHAATQQTYQVWAQEAGDSFRTALMWLVGGAVAALAIWRLSLVALAHLDARRERQRMAAMFAVHVLQARREQVRLERVEGKWMLRDYSSRQQWPFDVARTALAERGLLTVDA